MTVTAKELEEISLRAATLAQIELQIGACKGELGGAITQMLPSDDQIIADHVKSVEVRLGVILELLKIISRRT